MIWICLRVATCCNSTNSVNSRPTDTASPTGNCARRPSRDLQPDLIGGQKAEAARHRIHQRRIVARHHAQVIADAIADVGRQLHLDMPGRSIGRVGAGLVLQFAVDQHLHRRSAALHHDGIDRGLRHRLDLVERLVIGAAAEIRIEAEFLHRGGCGRRKPALELTVEIAAGIALAARIDVARAVRLELLVDQARHRLIGRGPVAVAAAEHRVTQFGKGVLWQIAAEPFDELGGVIGRRAIIRRAEDQHPALFRQLADKIVERRKLGRKTVDLGEIGDASRELFGGAEVRPVEHQQRRVVARPRPRARRRRA